MEGVYGPDGFEGRFNLFISHQFILITFLKLFLTSFLLSLFAFDSSPDCPRALFQIHCLFLFICALISWPFI